jgi:hypothetical protein
MAKYQLLFQSKEQLVVRRGQIPKIQSEIKKLIAPLGQMRLLLQVPFWSGQSCARTKTLLLNSLVFFFQYVVQIHQQRCVPLIVDRLAL